MSTIASGATVLVRQDGPAVRVTLNRPEKRNALSLELMEELIASLRRVSAEPQTCARSSSRPPARRSRPATT